MKTAVWFSQQFASPNCFLTGSQREAAGSGRQAEDQVEPGLEAHLLDRCHQRQVWADDHDDKDDDNFLTAVINFRRRSKIWPINVSIRSDLSDMDKVKLAAKAKMEGNLADLLPKKYKGGRELEDKEDELEGRLVFTDTSTTEASETVDPNKKWSTVVFSELPSDPAKSDGDMKKEKVSSLTKRFETKNMKDNEAYVIMWTGCVEHKQQLNNILTNLLLLAPSGALIAIPTY